MKILEQPEKKEKAFQQADVYGPEKEAWRQNGHYFTVEESKKLIKDCAKSIQWINE